MTNPFAPLSEEEFEELDHFLLFDVDTEEVMVMDMVIRLSLADQECFAQALLSPPQPTPALKRAFVRRSELMRAE